MSTNQDPNLPDRDATALRNAIHYAILQEVLSSSSTSSTTGSSGSRTSATATNNLQQQLTIQQQCTIQTMTELTLRYVQQVLSPDLYAFSNHRTSNSNSSNSNSNNNKINEHDVLLFIRRCPQPVQDTVQAAIQNYTKTSSSTKINPKRSNNSYNTNTATMTTGIQKKATSKASLWDTTAKTKQQTNKKRPRHPTLFDDDNDSDSMVSADGRSNSSSSSSSSVSIVADPLFATTTTNSTAWKKHTNSINRTSTVTTTKMHNTNNNNSDDDNDSTASSAASSSSSLMDIANRFQNKSTNRTTAAATTTTTTLTNKKKKIVTTSTTPKTSTSDRKRKSGATSVVTKRKAIQSTDPTHDKKMKNGKTTAKSTNENAPKQKRRTTISNIVQQHEPHEADSRIGFSDLYQSNVNNGDGTKNYKSDNFDCVEIEKEEDIDDVEMDHILSVLYLPSSSKKVLPVIQQNTRQPHQPQEELEIETSVEDTTATNNVTKIINNKSSNNPYTNHTNNPKLATKTISGNTTTRIGTVANPKSLITKDKATTIRMASADSSPKTFPTTNTMNRPQLLSSNNMKKRFTLVQPPPPVPTKSNNGSSRYNANDDEDNDDDHFSLKSASSMESNCENHLTRKAPLDTKTSTMNSIDQLLFHQTSRTGVKATTNTKKHPPISMTQKLMSTLSQDSLPSRC